MAVERFFRSSTRVGSFYPEDRPHGRRVPNGQWSKMEVDRWRLKTIVHNGLSNAASYECRQTLSFKDNGDSCLQSLVRTGKLVPLWLRVPNCMVDQLIVLACRAPIFRTPNLLSQS